MGKKVRVRFGVGIRVMARAWVRVWSGLYRILQQYYTFSHNFMHSALHRYGMGMALILGLGPVARIRLELGLPMILFCRSNALFLVFYTW